MERDYERIEQAIRYLEEHARRQPGLAELARHINLSPGRLQRLFKRYAGVSPKRFLQFLTVEYAKSALRESRSVLDAALESGLSGPGRLHDLFLSTEAVTPGEFTARGAGITISFGFHESPFGDCFLAITERGVCRLSFIGKGSREKALTSLQNSWSRARIRSNPGKTGTVIRRIFQDSNSRSSQPLKLLLKGTNFQIRVWEALLRIPPGHLFSYEDVATLAGDEKAVRATGTALGANQIAYLIPCHRVIRKNGAFGNYASGSARKKAMIAWEGSRRLISPS